MIDHPFRKLDNLVLTPHLGYVTEDSCRNHHRQMADGIDAWFKGGKASLTEAGLKAGLKEAGLRLPIPLPNKNIENNPMQRKEPLENKRGSLAWMLARKKHFDTSGKSRAHLQHPANCRPPANDVLPQSAA
jgi:hypothetical protein